MFIPTGKFSGTLRVGVVVGFAAALTLSPLAFAQGEQSKEPLSAAATKTVTGEVVDLMCYLDHGAAGDKHAQCAAKCIKGNGPVGLLSEGKAYLVVGEHKAINEQLAEYAGKSVTIKGKMAERGGLAMIENAEIVKK
jgi:hypothetical protein